MYAKPESILRKLSRVSAVLIVMTTLIFSARYLQTQYALNGQEQFWVRLAIAMLVGGLVYLTYRLTFQGKRLKEHHIRGTRLIGFDKAKRKARELINGADRIYWGLLELPISIGTSHFAVVGATGSGKTITLRLLMQSLFPKIGGGNNRRAIIYDAKQDTLPLLASICPRTEVKTLNPFDERSYAWDVAKDITSPATCQQVAAALIPDDRYDSSPYFNQASKHLLSGILLVFNKFARDNWTLRDVMVAIQDIDHVQKILDSTLETRNRMHHFRDQKTMDNVISTFTTKMQEYEFVAAAWDKAQGKVSISDWLDKEYVLVLGNSQTAQRATDEINRVIFRRMVELILSQTETRDRQTWVYLDEIRQFGKLDALNALLTKGRSKGACCVLGFQDIEGMRDVYGREVANELIGQCNNKAILKLNSPETSEWASKLFGDHELLEQRQSKNRSQHSIWKGSTSVSEQRVKRSAVMPGEFLDLPAPGEENGISGFYITPKVGSYHQQASHEWLKENLIDPVYDVPGLLERPEDHQILRPWDEEDLQRLDLTKIVTLKREAREPSLNTPQKRRQREYRNR